MDQRPQSPGDAPRYNGFAIASLIVALLSFLLLVVNLPLGIAFLDGLIPAGLSSGINSLTWELFLLIVLALAIATAGIVPSVVAISLGVAGIRRIRKCHPEQKGRGLALAGILIGSAEFVLSCGLIVALLVAALRLD